MYRILERGFYRGFKVLKNEETKLKLEIKSLLKLEQEGALEDVVGMAITTLTELQQKLQKKIIF